MDNIEEIIGPLQRQLEEMQARMLVHMHRIVNLLPLIGGVANGVVLEQQPQGEAGRHHQIYNVYVSFQVEVRFPGGVEQVENERNPNEGRQ